jgi:protein disulfide-isomerase
MDYRHGWKALVLALLLFGCRVVSGDDPQIVGWLDDYNQARRKGVETDRPVLLYVTSPDCHYCSKMQSMTFSDSQVVTDLQQRFVAARMHLAAESELGKQLMINIYPTTIIISPQGKILDYVRGYMDPVSLQQRMSNAISSQNRLAARD